MAFSVGIGLTNECDLRCPHCYRPDATVDRLSLETVRRVVAALPVASMNLGVGENGLHPEYRAVLDFLAERRIKTSITSNGTSIASLSDAEVKRFNSIEFSLDFPTASEHDAFRGPGNWRAVLAGLAGPGCGRSTVRVAPDGRILPCTYWPTSTLRLDALETLGEAIVETPEFVAARRIPDRCAGCPCRGGCAGRRALLGALGAPDPYCPFARGQRVRLEWPRATAGDLPKVGSACTTVVAPA